MSAHEQHGGPGAAPLPSILAVTFLASLGTAVFWHGLAFVAKHSYGFEQGRNLVLYAFMGVLYMFGAWRAGAVARRFERRLSPRGVLAWSLGVQAVACGLPILVAAEWALWAAATLVTIASAIAWPLVESYVSAGRHGPAMRSAIGWFNLVWMSAMPAPMLLMAPILERHGVWAIGALLPTNLLAWAMLIRLPVRPAAHDDGQAGLHVAASYPLLLRSVRVLLPISYVLTAGMAPILPYRFELLDVSVAAETPITSIWMVVRLLTVLVMWRLAFWHGRWGTLLFGGVCMTIGFALVVLAGSVPVMVGGLAALGVGTGLVYYSALYYAMAVGRAAVDASGTHEALIGAGYAVGPLAGLVGLAIGGPPAIVAVMWVLVAASAVPAALPYAAARRSRRASSSV
ncbi:MAG: MFS transporter [Planctomycetota bacterium]